MHEKEKIVSINGSDYRVRKMDPLTAVWIMNLLVTASINSSTTAVASEEPSPLEQLPPEERGKQIARLLWVTKGASLSEEIYRKIQLSCLRSCGAVVGEVTEAILMADGRWVQPKLQEDADAVNKLILETIQFNLCRFFTGDAKAAPGA